MAQVLSLKKFPDVPKPPLALERLLQEHVLPLAARRPPDQVCSRCNLITCSSCAAGVRKYCPLSCDKWQRCTGL